jgi:hypothetical protein
MKPQISITDGSTGETIKRDMTAAEIAQLENDQDQQADRRKEEALKAQAKIAIADRLGLTADELATLLA